MLLVSAAGTLLFAGLLALSFASPVTLESWARVAIEREIKQRVSATVQSLEQSALMRAAERALGANSREIQRAREELAATPERISSVATEMLDPKCACRARAREAARELAAGRLAGLARVSLQLTQLIEAKYGEVSQSLLREFRIFSGANALVFAALGVVALVRREAGLQLLLPTVVLLGAALLVGWLYLFTQNWAQTILLGDYVGLWYFPYVGLAVAFLADIVFNRARLTTKLFNAIASALGSLAHAVPC